MSTGSMDFKKEVVAKSDLRILRAELVLKPTGAKFDHRTILTQTGFCTSIKKGNLGNK